MRKAPVIPGRRPWDLIKKSIQLSMLSLLCLTLTSCSLMRSAFGPQQVKVAVQDISIKGMNGQNVHIDVRLEVDNPNSYSLTLGDFVYHLEVNGTELVSGNYGEDIKLTAAAKTIATIPLALNFTTTLKLLGQISQKNHGLVAKWRASAKAKSWLVDLPLSITGEKILALP